MPWYRENQRPLPWRATTDPYRIWLSEVILQQTRVDQGLAYWHRFVEHYPNVKALAEATEDQILRLWQGLGYYSRARNLQKAARLVMTKHGGIFPLEYSTLLELPGVGEYTAAAIGSICHGIPEPVVDGNVYRVLSRVFGIATPIDSTAGKKEFRTLAAELISHEHPGDHNQAMMELGATVCTPRNPRCGDCPLARKCVAWKDGRIAELPVKVKRAVARERHFNYLLIEAKGGIYLRKRTGKDIWNGLWELPLIETEKPHTRRGFMVSLTKELGAGWTSSLCQGPVKHVLSHQVIRATFWRAKPPRGFKPPKDWKKVAAAQLDEFPLPRLMERFVENSSKVAR